MLNLRVFNRKSRRSIGFALGVLMTAGGVCGLLGADDRVMTPAAPDALARPGSLGGFPATLDHGLAPGARSCAPRRPLGDDRVDPSSDRRAWQQGRALARVAASCTLIGPDARDLNDYRCALPDANGTQYVTPHQLEALKQQLVAAYTTDCLPSHSAVGPLASEFTKVTIVSGIPGGAFKDPQTALSGNARDLIVDNMVPLYIRAKPGVVDEPRVATCVIVGKRCNMCLTAAHVAIDPQLAPKDPNFQYADVYPLSGPNISMPDKSPIGASETVQTHSYGLFQTLSAALRANPGNAASKHTNEAMLIVYPEPIKRGACLQMGDFTRNTPPVEGREIMLAGYPTEIQAWSAISLKVSQGRILEKYSTGVQKHNADVVIGDSGGIIFEQKPNGSGITVHGLSTAECLHTGCDFNLYLPAHMFHQEIWDTWEAEDRKAGQKAPAEKQQPTQKKKGKKGLAAL